MKKILFTLTLICSAYLASAQKIYTEGNYLVIDASELTPPTAKLHHPLKDVSFEVTGPYVEIVSIETNLEITPAYLMSDITDDTGAPIPDIIAWLTENTAFSAAGSSASSTEPDSTKVSKPTDIATAGMMLVVNASGDDVEYQDVPEHYLSVGTSCFGHSVADGLVLSQRDAIGAGNNVHDVLLNSVNNSVPVPIIEWTADRSGTITHVTLQYAQLQANNAGGSSFWQLENTTTGELVTTNGWSAGATNWGLAGATFGGGTRPWTRVIATPLTVSQGDVIQFKLAMNNGNNWSIQSNNNQNGATWIGTAADAIGVPAIDFRGSFSHNIALEKVIDLADDSVSFVDNDGNIVDTTGMTPIDCPQDRSWINGDTTFIQRYDGTVDTLIRPIDVSRGRWEVTARNTGGQPAGDGLFPFQKDKLVQTHYSRLVEYNEDGSWTLTTDIHPVQVIMNAHTVGATGTAQRIFYIKDSSLPNGSRIPHSTDGVFGGAVPDVPATVVIPSSTTITIEGRSTSSGNNQALDVGASVEFIELTDYSTIPTACEINEYIHNINDYHLAIAHEGGGGTSMTLSYNGAAVTYDNLLNATDAGGGVINFSNGANQNYNRRASTIQALREVGDYFELTKPATGQFDTQMISITSDAATPANTQLGTYRLIFTGTNVTVQKPDGSTGVVSTPENGNYKIIRTHAGFSIVKNGAEIYSTDCITTDYTDETPISVVNASTGFYRIAEYKPTAKINTTSAASGTNITTGFDLTQATGMTLKFTFGDNNTSIQWQSQYIDVDQLLASYNASAPLDSYLQVYENDWMRLNVVDPATGELNFVDQGRDMAFLKAELWITAPEQVALVEVQNITTFTTTAAFQDLGDPDPEFTPENGAVVYIEYGDGNRDRFTFLDGIAKSERKGLISNDIEIQVATGGQLQIRDVASSSGIADAWYQYPIKAVGIGASINDHSASNYREIGQSLENWGYNESVTSDGAETFTFPKAYPTTDYSIQIQVLDYTNGASASVSEIFTVTKTPTGFTVNRDDDIEGTTTFDWKAIGPKN